MVLLICNTFAQFANMGKSIVFVQCEAPIHAMRKMFEADDNDEVLLIDAVNAFNSLNRSAAQHNIFQL